MEKVYLFSGIHANVMTFREVLHTATSWCTLQTTVWPTVLTHVILQSKNKSLSRNHWCDKYAQNISSPRDHADF